MEIGGVSGHSHLWGMHHFRDSPPSPCDTFPFPCVVMTHFEQRRKVFAYFFLTWLVGEANGFRLLFVRAP